MKAERRHELQESDLQRALYSARDYLNENGGRVALALIIVITVSVALSLGLRSRTAAYEDVWLRRSMLDFSDVEKGRESLTKLGALVDESGDPLFALEALTQQGEESLRLCQLVPNPPDMDLNEQARVAFEKLRTRFPKNILATGVALTGLASVEENAFAIDNDMTHKQNAHDYLTGVTENPQMTTLPLYQVAVDRLARIDETFSTVRTLLPEIPLDAGADDIDSSPVGGSSNGNGGGTP